MARGVSAGPCLFFTSRRANFAFITKGSAMGCMPLPLLFLLGTGLGYLVDARVGALWGAGIGLAAGIAATAAFILRLRGKR